jgi:2-methylcitrate dehydratase PrpD
MATPPPVTDLLARFVSATDLSAMPDKTLANAKMHILDTFGVALAGVSTEVAGIAFGLLPGTGRSDEASIWGT